ncbi:hypothetical protein KJ865_08970 [Myxococcota bacterium]|nr:hypothetical protein [Myxococcota bacterium]
MKRQNKARQMMMRKYIKSTKLNDPDSLTLVEMYLRKHGSEYFEALTKTFEGLKVSIIVGRKLPEIDGTFHTTHALILLGQDIENNKDATSIRIKLFEQYRDELLADTRGPEDGEVLHFLVFRVWEALQEIRCIEFSHFSHFYTSMVGFENKMHDEGWL